MPLKLFKKKKSLEPEVDKETGMVYSMTPRHGHTQDVFDENGIRQVAGCLPIDPINKRFLLISSSSNPDTWVIPKGGWEKDETQKQAAMRETWEEAGVKGTITRHIGVFAEKTKTGVKAHHWIYEMEIKQVTQNFPEQSKRKRRWFTFEEAMLAVKAHYIHDALSMSSLSPMVYEEGGKKKKKKKKEKAESDDSDEEKSKKKDKKKKKSEEEEEEDNEATQTEKKNKKKKSTNSDDEDEDETKKNKKNKGKNKDQETSVPIVVTTDMDQLGQQLSATKIEPVYPQTISMPEHVNQLPTPEAPPNNHIQHPFLQSR